MTKYMSESEFIAYRILSIGAKMLPQRPAGEVQAFLRDILRVLRIAGRPVDEGKEIATRLLKAAKEESKRPEVRAYLAQQALRAEAWERYQKEVK